MSETSAKILADSVSPSGHRITTFECVYPRIILAEVNTHRLLSRVSASSRAIPVEKMIRRVMEDPYVPTHWGKNQKGMQAEEDVEGGDALKAANRWREARMAAVKYAQELLDIGIHKQITNRLIEPFMWHPTVITATEWDNWDHLRDHKAAHPDFRDLAHCMRELRLKSEPYLVREDGWHLPYVSREELQSIPVQLGRSTEAWEHWCKVAVGRCARVSTLTHDGQRDLQADVDLHDKMFAAGHTSPYEHVARPMTQEELELFKQKKIQWDPEVKAWTWLVDYTHFLGNVQGWVQLRKQIPHEEDILGR